MPWPGLPPSEHLLYTPGREPKIAKKGDGELRPSVKFVWYALSVFYRTPDRFRAARDALILPAAARVPIGVNYASGLPLGLYPHRPRHTVAVRTFPFRTRSTCSAPVARVRCTRALIGVNYASGLYSALVKSEPPRPQSDCRR